MSTDGEDWVQAETPSVPFSGPFSFFARLNDRIAAISPAVDGQPSLISDDGIHWEEAPWLPAMTKMVKGDRVYLGMRGKPTGGSSYGGQALWRSEDGIQWDAVAPGFLSEWGDGGCSYPAFGEGRFVFVTKGAVHWSTDGLDWQAVPEPLSEYRLPYCLVHTGEAFFGMLSSPAQNERVLFWSEDGLRWQAGSDVRAVQAAGSDAALDWDFTYAGGSLVCFYKGSYSVLHSPDGATWETARLEESGRWPTAIGGVAWGNGRFVVVAAAGCRAFGRDLGDLTMDFPDVLQERSSYLIRSGGALVTDRRLTSFDGTDWRLDRQAVPFPWERRIFYREPGESSCGSGDRFCPFRYSYDGVDWRAPPPPHGDAEWRLTGYNGAANRIVGNGSVFVGSTDRGLVYSFDCHEWQPVSTLAECHVTWLLSLGDRFFAYALVGPSRRFFKSRDGIYWKETVLQSPGYPRAGAFGNGTFLIITQTGASSARLDFSVHAAAESRS